MTDVYAHDNSVIAPSKQFAAVSPNDSTDLPSGRCKALWIGTAGDVAVIDPASGSAVTFKAPQGLLPIRTDRVKNSGTTASNIVALY